MKLRLASLLIVGVVSIGVNLAAENGGRQVTLFFTGEVRGTFEPCGCQAGPTGGLSRRAGYTRQFVDTHHPSVLHVDVGNYFQQPGRYAAPVNNLLLKTLDEFPLSVLNLGTEDLHLWDRLAEIDSEATQVISTNLIPRSSDRPRPARYAVVSVPNTDLKIGFLGLAWPDRVKPNSGFRGLDPLAAIEDVKDEVVSQADFLVVLANINQLNLDERETIEQIARQHPEIYAVLFTERRFILPEPTLVGNAVILSAVERGRYLGQLTFRLDPEGKVSEVEPTFVELKDGVAEVAEILASQKSLAARIR